jgi:hypothetical protein
MFQESGIMHFLYNLIDLTWMNKFASHDTEGSVVSKYCNLQDDAWNLELSCTNYSTGSPVY